MKTFSYPEQITQASDIPEAMKYSSAHPDEMVRIQDALQERYLIATDVLGNQNHYIGSSEEDLMDYVAFMVK